MDIDNLENKQLVNEHKRLLNHNAVLRRRLWEVYQIKVLLSNEHHKEAAEIVQRLKRLGEFDDLWVATTKGGVFTTEERSTIKDPNFLS